MLKNLRFLGFLSIAFSLGAMEQPKLDPVWGLSARKGRRSAMEDTHIALLPFGPANLQASLFGVFDGHGGDFIAKQVVTVFSDSLLPQLGSLSPQDALKKAFELTENTLKQRYPNERSGTTAIVGLVKNNQLNLAWIGDSRAIVVRNGQIVAATRDHKPDDPSEKRRIEAEGGFVVIPREFGEEGIARVGGNLATSRAFGDFELKSRIKGISAVPDIQTVNLQDNDVLVIGCDGLWDVYTNEQVAQVVADLIKKDTATLLATYPLAKPMGERIAEEDGDDRMKLIARALRDYAFDRNRLDFPDMKNTDNISVMVVQFKKKPTPAAATTPQAQRPRTGSMINRSYELFKAINNDDNTLLENLIKQGVDVNFQHPQDKWTPLMQAVAHKNIVGVYLLLAAGADASLVAPDAGNALTLAAAYQQPEMIKLFLFKKVDPTVKRGKDNKNASELAQQYKRQDIADLIQRGR